LVFGSVRDATPTTTSPYKVRLQIYAGRATFGERRPVPRAFPTRTPARPAALACRAASDVFGGDLPLARRRSLGALPLASGRSLCRCSVLQLGDSSDSSDSSDRAFALSRIFRSQRARLGLGRIFRTRTNFSDLAEFFDRNELFRT